jgi:hypothetical protein
VADVMPVHGLAVADITTGGHIPPPSHTGLTKGHSGHIPAPVVRSRA